MRVALNHRTDYQYDRRVSFSPQKVGDFSIEVDLVAWMAVINPIDSLDEPSADACGVENRQVMG